MTDSRSVCSRVEVVRAEVALLEAERERLPRHSTYGIDPGFQHRALTLRNRANHLRHAIGERPVGWYQGHDYDTK